MADPPRLLALAPKTRPLTAVVGIVVGEGLAHRDAAKHAGEISTADLPKLVDDAAQALGKAGQADKA